MQRDYQNRFVIPREVAEHEFREAGFNIKSHIDFLPKYAMWRTYVLEKNDAGSERFQPNTTVISSHSSIDNTA